MFKPFVLSVRMIIQDIDGNCLLVRRSKTNKSNVGKWEFPGGKIDPGEAFYEALLREVKEETGLKVVVNHVAGVTESETSLVRIVSLIFKGTKELGEVCLSDEHDCFLWVPYQKLSVYDLVAHLKVFVAEHSDINQVSKSEENE
jgi:8-oxo-dGTP diphosphatase